MKNVIIGEKKRYLSILWSWFLQASRGTAPILKIFSVVKVNIEIGEPKSLNSGKNWLSHGDSRVTPVRVRSIVNYKHKSHFYEFCKLNTECWINTRRGSDVFITKWSNMFICVEYFIITTVKPWQSIFHLSIKFQFIYNNNQYV
jgi:hypothetical protein